jgi:deoxyribodipyrimidine photo-lyase
MTAPFPLTRDAALARWRVFMPQVTRYGSLRNFVSKTHAQVSRLSPAIRLGLITPEEIVRETLSRHDLSAVEQWVKEVCWRTYWKGWLEMRPQVWRTWRQRVHQLRASLPSEVISRVNEVSEGRSGVAVMDHFARELRETGYLHNHARMWWASFWIHAERLPWELGAEFFFQHLLDADPASNTLSWRWVAGLQTAGKTYLVRRSNLERYCESSLLEDATGLDRLEDGRITPVALTDHTNLARHSLPDRPTYCPQLSGRIGLWIHADDLSLESSPLGLSRPASAAVFTSNETYARYGLSRARIDSLHTALQDGLTRTGVHLGCATALSDTPSMADGLKSWVAIEKLDAVVAMAPNIGPVADALPSIRRALSTLNVPLNLVRRPWDAQMFPSAQSGFFPFWEKTSRWLARQFPPTQMTLL